ncbi:CbrC family protein [Erythrobacter sp. BLCC-B19]|uniref:CbrC family protein n=1 Tax=Erythrobacter sp. BLCC-B19 TaxID=3025315 RepID=UPI0023601783|nr:CbrC family protein [Erythrobacter sp. BLCC-B19]WDA40923.1 CbrC family protein [Erythrobacter sp. BLCC-B19]
MDWLRRLLGKGSAPAPAAPPPPLPVFDPATAPSQAFAQPHFRFFPGAYTLGAEGEDVFRREIGPCHACGMRDIHAFTGVIYTARQDQPTACAQCIADGGLAKFLNEAHFSLHDAEVEALDWRDPLVAEVQQRTPGFATFNPFAWPVHDGLPMAFMGYGDEERWKYVPQALAAMRAANEGEDCFPCANILLFRQVEGEVWRAVFDPD